MKKYNRTNFFKHTYCEWVEVSMTTIEGRQPDYKSKTGSMYYFSEEGVIRYSNHWGRAANCRWKLVATEKKNGMYCLAYATWNSFFSNNEEQAIYGIVYDESTNKVEFKHKEMFADSTGIVFRNARDTNTRIKKIIEIATTDTWFKYFEHISIEEVRKEFIKELLYSNLDFAIIKRSLLETDK